MKKLFYILILLLILIQVDAKQLTREINPSSYGNSIENIEEKLSSLITVNFEVKDSFGNSLENVLIIIQGITNQQFTAQLLTNVNGEASINLNKNEIFVYAIYKLGYESISNNFFANSNKEIIITLKEFPEDAWYFYYENNGEIEVKFKSLDQDTNYIPGEYINEILEVKNIAGKNLDLLREESSLITVDSSTLKRVRWWGGLRRQDVLIDLTLKKDGWLKSTVKDGVLEVCVGNAIGKYKGQPFDVSGNEFICKTDKAENLIPDWILRNNYKINFNLTYLIDGQKKNFYLLTQDFFIDNSEWTPEMELISPGMLYIINKEITYSIPMEYPAHFVYYSLSEAPAGMKIDGVNGIIKWTPTEAGRYKVVVRAYYPYFEDDSRIAYTDGEFSIRVVKSICPTADRKKILQPIYDSLGEVKVYCR